VITIVVVVVAIFVLISFSIIVLVVRLPNDAVQQGNVRQVAQARRVVRRSEHAQFAQDVLLDDVTPVDVTAPGFPGARATLAGLRRRSTAGVAIGANGIRATGSDPKMVLECQTAESGDRQRRANAKELRHRRSPQPQKLFRQSRTETDPEIDGETLRRIFDVDFD